jgi:hypothetical protein
MKEKKKDQKSQEKRLKGTDSWGGNWAAINRSASRAGGSVVKARYSIQPPSLPSPPPEKIPKCVFQGSSFSSSPEVRERK